MKKVLLITSTMLLLVACGQAAELAPSPAPSQVPTMTEIKPLETSESATDSPTHTPEPTTVEFLPQPKPSRTPTEPKTPPTETAEPIIPPPSDTSESVAVAFVMSDQILGNTRSFDVVIKDIDLDNDNDVFTANYIGASSLWLNGGDGIFVSSGQRFDISEVHAAGIDDFNGDELPDILLLSHATAGKVYFNDVSGAFTDSGQNIGSPEDSPGMIVMGDVENDGDVDVFISYFGSPNRLW